MNSLTSGPPGGPCGGGLVGVLPTVYARFGTNAKEANPTADVGLVNLSTCEPLV